MAFGLVCLVVAMASKAAFGDISPVTRVEREGSHLEDVLDSCNISLLSFGVFLYFLPVIRSMKKSL